jgi:ketosteroid isomerase-like protein
MNPARIVPFLAGIALLAGCASAPAPIAASQNVAVLREQVVATERGFARTMADRDFAAFTSYLSEEAIFFTGRTPLRGKAAVAANWKRFYEEKEAPFRWEPAEAEVLDSGTLALSSGPVHDPAGKQIATFFSVWRQEAPGVWRIVLDKGTAACDCARP